MTRKKFPTPTLWQGRCGAGAPTLQRCSASGVPPPSRQALWNASGLPELSLARRRPREMKAVAGDRHSKDAAHRVGRRHVLPALLAALLFAAMPVAHADDGLPFREGEFIEFRLRWGIVVAGRATLEVHERTTVDGVPAHHFSTSIRTTGLVDKLYKVRTRIDSYVSLDGTRVLTFEKNQREGRERNHFVVDFDWDEKVAVLTDKLKDDATQDPVSLAKTATDLIGALYRFRRLPLAAGETHTMPVTDGKKLIQGKAEILKRQKVKVPAGKFNAYKVAPQTSDLSGVFDKDEDADLFLWFTADERRMPVRVASAVMIGNFIAEAVEVQNGGEDEQ